MINPVVPFSEPSAIFGMLRISLFKSGILIALALVTAQVMFRTMLWKLFCLTTLRITGPGPTEG